MARGDPSDYHRESGTAGFKGILSGILKTAMLTVAQPHNFLPKFMK
jgi:hypothetical protein